MEDNVKKGAFGLPANSPTERFLNGLWSENPTLVLMIGMCPTLAVTTGAINGISMGLATTVVLALSNLVIAAIRNIVPDTVRIPAFIVVIASFVTMVDLMMAGYLPAMYESLGVYIPLIVVNCIIFGRAEAYASKNGMIPSFFDGIGMGLGFTIAITIMGLIRELIGAGTAFDIQILGEGSVLGGFFANYQPVSIFIQQAGAFLVLGFMVAIMNQIKFNMENKGKDTSKFKEIGEDEAKAVEAAKKPAEAIEAKNEKTDVIDTAKAEAKKRADSVKEKVEDAKDKVKVTSDKAADKAEEVKDKVEETVDKAADKVEEVKDKVADKVDEVKDKVADKVDEVKDKVADKADEAADKAADAADEVLTLDKDGAEPEITLKGRIVPKKGGDE